MVVVAVDVVRAGFAEWATARTAVLLRLAYLVTGSPDTAGETVRNALARVEARWTEVLRTEDPDRYVLRAILTSLPRVRTPRTADGDDRHDLAWSTFRRLPDRQRAVVVLRHLEGHDDREIADLLDCSPATVRAQLDRASAALTAALARRHIPPADGDRILREALVARTADAPDALPPTPAGSVPPPGGRRSPAWIAALAVVVVMVTVAGVSHETRSPTGAIRYAPVAVPSTWRVESYAGVQLRVPETWGWGGAPIHGDFNGGGLGGCGSNQAFALPGQDAGYVPSNTPYAGRPARMSDVCVSWGSDGVMPGADAVWFASPLPVGTKSVGGRVAETRRSGTQHVTVFADDPVLRRRILGSVSEVDIDANGCPTTAVQAPTAGAPGLVPSSLSVCVYSQDTGDAVLLWSARKDQAAAQDYAGAFKAARTGSACQGTPQGQWVALGVADLNGAATRWDIFDPGCDRLVGRAGDAAVVPATVRPWAGGGTVAYVSASGLRAGVASYFRSPQG